uniref:10 kDa chaperonin n=1 Tax=Chromera velia CCMP2878 TaxID=1169474 RepID=A0A0G4G273_9ALVE|mmetsp:Transcript_34197/g.67627  ORF Transcript_34197/g.67627 Transcript_34197/m.67627 type:complete len:103 (+) Transcript_34197:135-443(+)|eukprot:Cvel_19897.t1-p1 / transcript=Cvel_19897.t1 / gene=Cvel_19897 / organism=Chromera_velia_CCMP2878 / gene_product=10 kDa chaperonin, putative / transcript_product=10 kDa chaperonin, putative / location=Cvel_scaffold1747:5579-7654(+) / protein_length=102 / sequence_SO=supercontig / SO=protein_coding / is_pseudo=false
MSGMVKRFTPLFDRVLVQRLKQEAQTKSGIFLPDSAKGASNQATVVAVGAGRLTKEGNKVPVSVSVGQTVIVPEYGGMTLKFDDEEFHIFRDEDIVGVLKSE